MRYTKQGFDSKYRVVSLVNLNVDNFQDFLKDSVDYPEGCVIEILRSDGTTHISYGRARQIVNVCAYDNCLFFPATVPSARLWVRAADGSGICYKVPLRPEIRDQNAYILIPGGPKNAELVGDDYFEAVYELHRV